MRLHLLLLAFLIFSQNLLAEQKVLASENHNESESPTKSGTINSIFSKTLDKFSRKDENIKNENSNFNEQISSTSLQTPQAPKPFNIEYKVSLNGLPTGLKAEAKLRKHESHYIFTLEAESWILSYQEKSAFHWNKNSPCELLTENYQFNFEGFGQTESFEVEINPDIYMANSKTRKGNVQYEVPGNVSDALAYLFKLQCDVKNNNLNPNYNIAYDNGVDHYEFEYQGKETLRTSLGKLETLVLKRVYKSDNTETTYWIAPQVDYLMVKMKHKEGKIVTATLKIKSINYDIDNLEKTENKEETIELNEDELD